MKLFDRILASALCVMTVCTVSLGAAPSVSFDASAASQAVSASQTVSRVSLNITSLTLGTGETAALTAKLSLKNDAVKKWVSSDTTVASVNNGKVKARSQGEAVITVRTEKGFSATCRVIVKAAPSGIVMNASEICIGVNECFQLRGTIPSGSASASTVYKADNARIVTVNSRTGLIKGRKAGTSAVTVKTYNGKTASCKVRVLNEPSSVSFGTSKLTLGIGESFRLKTVLPEKTASYLRNFRSSSSSVASVDKDGVITAKSAGTATISLTLYNGVKASCEVTVKNAPKSARMNIIKVTLDKGKNCGLYCILDSDQASYSKVFSSSNTGVATVDKNGVVRTRGYGEATITVKLYNGVKASCKVTVQEPYVPVAVKGYLDLQDDLAVLAPGETFRISPAYSGEGSLTCVSADKSVATVSSSGVIKAVAPGTTDITVTSASGKSSKVAVIVTGDRYSTTFPTASETDALLNKEKPGAGWKTNCPDVDSLVDSIFEKIIKPGMTNAQKVRACYEYLAKNCTYGRPYGTPELTHNYKYSSDVFIICEGYSLLKNHSGTCENFYCALTILFRRLGYKADVVDGLTGMRAGGKGGHFWTDVTLGNKHYSFDAQIENNNLGYGGEVLYYWYGTKPEHNFKTCEYQILWRVHDFAVSD